MGAELDREGVGSPTWNRDGAAGADSDGDRDELRALARNQGGWVEAEPDRERVGSSAQNRGGAVEAEPEGDRDGVGAVAGNRGSWVEAEPDREGREVADPVLDKTAAAPEWLSVVGEVDLNLDANLAVEIDLAPHKTAAAVERFPTGGEVGLKPDGNLAVGTEECTKVNPALAVDLNWGARLVEELERIAVFYEQALAC